MKLVVGLGNPGANHARNRHNVGWLALDTIAAAHGFALWRAKFRGQIAEGRLGPAKVLLLKPETYMNLSGDSVRAAVGFYKLEPADVIVLHDELDLAPGRVRVKTGGGHAGHNGLRSIAAQIGPDFTRVRIGIGHPGDKRVVSNHVLNDFSGADADWLDPLLAAIAAAAPDLAAGDPARFASAVAQAAPAAKPPKPQGKAAKPAPPPPAPEPSAPEPSAPEPSAPEPSVPEEPAPEEPAPEEPAPEEPAPEEPAPEEPAPEEPAPEEDRSPLQRLIDRFR